MNRVETIIEGLNAGNFDDVLKIYYGNAAVAIQRKRYTELLETYQATFQGRDAVVFSAPGRTELGGNHTDHNHGKVLAGSVNLDFIAAVQPSADPIVEIHSHGYAPFRVDLSDLKPRKEEEGSFSALLRGVAARMNDLGYRIGGFTGCIMSDVLPGSGLSSSAAVEVLIGTIFSTFFNNSRISPTQIAQIGQYAENVYFGKPCGLMDQMACATGGIIEIDFLDPKNPVVRKVEYDFTEHGYVLMVVDTGGNHADLTPDYAAAPAEMKAIASFFGQETLRSVKKEEVLSSVNQLRERTNDRAILRALHYYGDNRRVDLAVEALRDHRLADYFALVNESADSSWELLQNCSTPQNPGEQGVSLALALSRDFLAGDGACRVHGGGFAGTIQVYVPADRADDYIAYMEAAFTPGCVTPLSIRQEGVALVIG